MSTQPTPDPIPPIHVPATRSPRRRPIPFDPAESDDFDHDNQTAQDYCRGIGGYRE